MFIHRIFTYQYQSLKNILVLRSFLSVRTSLRKMEVTEEEVQAFALDKLNYGLSQKSIKDMLIFFKWWFVSERSKVGSIM